MATETQSAHYNRGCLPVAFVFSAPGAAESKWRRPVASFTGVNLSAALEHLYTARPDLFPSRDRYDYRITNVHRAPLAKALGDRVTEAADGKIVEAQNVKRVVEELEGVQLVVLCGLKAELLGPSLATAKIAYVQCSHTGNRSLNLTYPIDLKSSTLTSSERRMMRVSKWADGLIRQLGSFKLKS